MIKIDLLCTFRTLIYRFYNDPDKFYNHLATFYNHPVRSYIDVARFFIKTERWHHVSLRLIESRDRLYNLSLYIEAIKYINKISNTNLNDENTIVICYFFKSENYSEAPIDVHTSNWEYLNFFKKQKNKTFNIFLTEKGYVYKKKNVFEDKENKIKDLFFRYPFESGSYIIIKPDGSFVKHISEYNDQRIIQFIRQDKKNKKK